MTPSPSLPDQARNGRFLPQHGLYQLQRYLPEFGNSVVNCFDSPAWRRATALAWVGVRLVVRAGHVRVSLQHVAPDGSRRALGLLEQSGPGTQVLPALPLADLDGAILPDVHADGTGEGQKANYDLLFVTDDQPVTPDLRINYIFCTFRRAEYVQHNVQVFRDYLHSHRAADEAHLTVIDNGHDGSTLGGAGACGVDTDADVTVLANNNTGGAGGFGRGIYESCYGALAPQGFSHVCLLDDDIYLHPEMFARNTAFLRYLKPGYHVGAPMYPTSEARKVPRRSACFGHKFTGTLHPRDIALGAGLDTGDIPAFLTMDREPDSTGWWWSCFAVKDVHRIGLPYPFFIKMDDVEYSLRLQAAGVKLVIPFSFWVLHDDFEEKYSAAMQYFRHRNRWLLLALRGEVEDSDFFMYGFDAIVRDFVSGRRYEHAQLLLDGMSHFLQGPEHLVAREKDILAGVFARVRREKNIPMPQAPDGAAVVNGLAPPSTSRNQRLTERTWNNHFLPFKDRVALDTTRRHGKTDVRRAREVSYWNAQKGVGYTVRRNSPLAMRQMLTLRRLRTRIRQEFPTLLARYRQAAAHFTSPMFWSTYGKHGAHAPLTPTPQDAGVLALQHTVARLVSEAGPRTPRATVTAEDMSFFNSLRNRYKGQRCFVLGNGPSLTISDLELLKDEVTFAANKIYLCFDETDWRPSFYSVEDLLVAQNCRAEILAVDRTTKIFADHMLPYLPRQANHHYARWLPPRDNRSPFREFSTDLTKGICWGSTITYSMLQMAVHMGFEEIYILGLDHSYVEPKTKDGGALVSEGEVNHFHPDYRKPGERWHYPVLDRLEHSYQFAKDYCDAIGVRIYNASRSSKLEIFPRADLDDVLGSDATASPTSAPDKKRFLPAGSET
ncbi:glycosyltransferase [Rhodobacteraceae bacterium R_SAG3]|uniref:6-hydroxymethylpterin diphosphokinase MptE-like protein n=1 Tax=Tritonibacter mobilis TaxID=379347 RepID=UPI000806E081|nr:glycosyltransferase [Tritonibacter mobilis]NKX74016.1 glycosyltransferase [Rhodobacteraceae bacterium R_SAG3]